MIHGSGEGNWPGVWKYICENLDLFGEVLRHLFFVTDWRHPPIGCYQTFDVNENVVPCERKPLKDNPELFFKCFSADVEGIGRVEMAYHWHFGDGVLMFTLEDGSILINEDCKKDSGWMWTTKEYVG